MNIKSYQRPIVELSHSLAFNKAKLIDKEYKLDVSELSAADKLQFMAHILQISSNLDTYIQEYLNDACQDRMYAESQPYGDWNE